MLPTARRWGPQLLWQSTGHLPAPGPVGWPCNRGGATPLHQRWRAELADPTSRITAGNSLALRNRKRNLKNKIIIIKNPHDWEDCTLICNKSLWTQCLDWDLCFYHPHRVIKSWICKHLMTATQGCWWWTGPQCISITTVCPWLAL